MIMICAYVPRGLSFIKKVVDNELINLIMKINLIANEEKDISTNDSVLRKMVKT